MKKDFVKPKLSKVSSPPLSVEILMSEEVDQLLPALALVKKELKGVTKKSDNPFFKSSYADLNEHLDTVEPLLEEHELMLLQPTNATEQANFVITMIVHPESGQHISAVLSIPKLADAQKIGAAITYFRRFGINSLLALKSLDDDGESAVGRGKFKNRKKKKSRNFSNEDY